MKKTIAEIQAELPNMTINEIAVLTRSDWKKVAIPAVPYLDAMRSLSSINDAYIADSGVSIVSYFLSNATSWRGEVARAVKKELNKRVKSS